MQTAHNLLPERALKTGSGLRPDQKKIFKISMMARAELVIAVGRVQNFVLPSLHSFGSVCRRFYRGRDPMI